MPGYRPDLSGLSDPRLMQVLRRNFDAIASQLRGGANGAVVAATASGGGATATAVPDHVQTRHIVAPWTISERVAVTRIVQDSAAAYVVFSDADTQLVEIEG